MADVTDMMSPLVFVAVPAVQPEHVRHPATVRAHEQLLLSRWLPAASHTGAP